MAVNPTLERVTQNIITRSAPTRAAHLERMRAARSKGSARAHLSCSGQAHAYAASGKDKDRLTRGEAGQSRDRHHL